MHLDGSDCNVCGVVGVDGQRNSEVLVNKCYVYGERAGNYSFSSGELMKMYSGEGGMVSSRW